jgi:hypothetical protein
MKNIVYYSILGIVVLCVRISLCIDFETLSLICEIDYLVRPLCLPVGPFVSLEQLGSQWEDILNMST